MKLNHTISGPQDGLPVLLVHGLYGQGRNLGAQARKLAETRPVITVDLRNHGESPHDPDASYAALAGDLAALIGDLGGRVDLVGHSMGGKAAMLLALTHPELVRRLAVLDIAPIAYGHDQTRFVDAMEALQIATMTRRAEADRALAEHVPERGVRAFLLQNLDLKAQPVAWRLNLSALREYMPQIVGWPEDAPKGSFAGKVLEIRGELSDYVTEAGEAALRAHFPQARTVTIKGAGHWLHADAADAVGDTLAAFLGDGKGD
ncbi:alpha/beta fold hydrolase [Paracoccus sp. 1_MG-2023]|uniref:alpha/beta fold hydrolase n=1 Tax=unclassified Paracoccus (in: a-proteobacteria) TaxID=2688777 RepID=UPI001C087671|nr:MULTISPECIES: alpha/beta fold hydrolase [unclassified Paracoccus (in: a-proteobacteria)]MBU2958403.1 alpha/beta fold hydrolase [Paracoccus sp. C2R09]MDO6668612.1 alpha/beta fold hydrolase [Paracoccus sp. 1_MG-2023]